MFHLPNWLVSPYKLCPWVLVRQSLLRNLTFSLTRIITIYYYCRCYFYFFPFCQIVDPCLLTIIVLEHISALAHQHLCSLWIPPTCLWVEPRPASFVTNLVPHRLRRFLELSLRAVGSLVGFTSPRAPCSGFS